MEDPKDNPFDRVVGPWQRLIDDMAVTAARYRETGRTVVELHPGDVAVGAGETGAADEQRDSADPASRPIGFDVVVPDDEFERLRELLADRTVDSYDVFRATGNGMVFLLLALESGDELAVLIPVYYDLNDRQTLEDVARDHGLYTRVRPLARDAVVTVEHENPALFFPE